MKRQAKSLLIKAFIAVVATVMSGLTFSETYTVRVMFATPNNTQSIAQAISYSNELQQAFDNTGIDVDLTAQFITLTDAHTAEIQASSDPLSKLTSLSKSNNWKLNNELLIYVNVDQPTQFSTEGIAGIAWVPSSVTDIHRRCNRKLFRRKNPNKCDVPRRYRNFVADKGFSVNTPFAPYVVTHEVGHNLGLAHGNTDGENGYLKGYGRGFFEPLPSFRNGYRTVMTYHRAGYTILNRFSGTVFGTSDRDAKRALTETSLPWLQ